MVRNPMNPSKEYLISLEPQDVDIIVFWTKNPAPLIPHCEALDSLYRYYVHFTVNGYSRAIELNTPGLNESINSFHLLSSIIGPDRVIWRYDPIILSPITPADYHLRRFDEISTALQGHTHGVVISLLDIYRKAVPRLEHLNVHAFDEPPRSMLQAIADMARSRGMEISACAEPFDLSDCGISPGKCIDDEYTNQVFGIKLSSRKDVGQRPACGCIKSRDIGAFNTCPNGCLYCYASSGTPQTHSHSPHNPESLSLCRTPWQKLPSS